MDIFTWKRLFINDTINNKEQFSVYADFVAESSDFPKLIIQLISVWAVGVQNRLPVTSLLKWRIENSTEYQTSIHFSP